MHDGTVDDQDEVRREWAALPDACGGPVSGAVDACCLNLEKWVLVDVRYEGDELWLDPISVEGGEEGLWVNFVERLDLVQEKYVQGAVGVFCLLHEASDDLDGLRAGSVSPESILRLAQL